MKHFNSNKAKFLITGLLFTVFLLVSSCQNWMSNDDFISKIESEVHDANAAEISVYVRFANDNMGKTEPSGSTTMKVDVASRVSAVPADAYGFVKWAAFSSKDFATNKNHSKLTYISEEAYNRDFKKLEISADEVIFSTPNEPITDVIIKKNRSDLFIIPIVAARPSIRSSVPSGGDADVVKNTSIRILFSKAIDGDTLLDSEGNLNFSVTTSESYFGEENQEIEPKDITDFFDYNLSTSGKMLTLSLKEKLDENGNKTGELANLLDNRQNITITLFEGICDTDGYAMNGNFSFKFTTGTSTDSLAPIIDVIFGGTGQNCDVFVSFHDVDSDGNPIIDGKATDASKNAPKDITSTEYTEALVAQRIYDKLNIFVKATDIISSGNGAINPTKDLSENTVNAIGIAASLWLDKDGKAVKLDNTTTIARKNHIYIPSTIDPNCQITEVFNEVVPLDKNGNKYNGGTIYTYDVSNLPDGLIKIDVWGVDMTGNSGAPAEDGSPNKTGSAYYDKHDNSYKSIFVVKDTTAPDAAEEAKKLLSNSAAAPYYWYNNTTLTSMQLYDIDTNQIVDAGHAKLRSLTKNLSWNFVVGKADTAPAANNNGWKYIHDQDTGASIKYTLASAKAPAKDGPVDITMFIRDDIGNVSDPVLLKSVMYDNTQPTVKLKSGKGDFVKASGEETLHVSESKVISQILKVEIGEENVDNAGSGIRRIEIHVKKGGQDVALPLDPTSFAVKYAPASISNPTPASAGIRDIGIVAAADDAATSNNIKVFNVNDSNKITSGTLFIYGITLDDADGQYEVLVDLYDSALNKTPKTAKTIMARDTTDPVINKVQVMNVASRKVYGQDEVTWWLPYDRFEDANNLSKVTLKITANEAGSGLKYLKLAENAEFTENTKLYVGSELLTRDTDYKLNTATKTIELLDWYTPKLINANNGSHEITLENIKLNNINAPADTSQGNKIKLTTDDFVGKTTDNANNIYYGDTNVTGTLVYADSVAPQIASLTVEDSAKHTTNNPDEKAYNKDNFTDSQTVVLYLTLGDTEAGNKGSGVNKVILSDNALFTGTTEIFVVDGSTETKLASPADYEIASDNKSVTFKKVFTETNKLKFTNVNIISATNGQQIIKADVQDFAGIKSLASKNTNSITLDNVAPKVVQNDQQNDVKWIPNPTVTGVTTGQEKNMLVDTQSLQVDFEEATAGVKIIKFEIHHDGQPRTNSYAKPFDNSDFAITYTSAQATNTLVKGTDYNIRSNNADPNIQQYIELKETYKSGSFTFDNITLTNGDTQGNYVVNVVMLDAAENKVDCKQVITIDTVAPAITQPLSIEDLVHSKELTASGAQPVLGPDTGTFWLPSGHVGTVNDHAPTEIPVIITIHEVSSGVKVITFQQDAVLSATNTKLWTMNGTNRVEFGRSKYTINESAKTITITDTDDCFKSASNFRLLITGIGFANTDTSTAASANSIKVKVSDVAMGESESVGTPEPTIYSDSRIPAAPTGLTLKDRAHSTVNKTIEASAGYTNESIVDMTFSLTDSEKFGSGYHKFVLTGASFIGVDSADKTTITVKDSSGTVIPNVEFALSDDGKTLTLKKTGQNTNDHAVIRQAVSVELKNVQLDNASTNGSHTVTLKAYDLTGWASTASSTSITLDTDKPALEKGVFAANYTTAYYQPSINVYPHANGESATGVPINYGTETYQKDIPTFYTATTYKTGYYQVNGEVSSSSSAPAVTNFVHGAVLGIRGKDNIRLGGWTRAKTFLYYYKYTTSDTLFSKTEADILGSTNPELDINNKGNNNNQPTGNNSATGTTLWFGFDEGKYSAVIVDEAGNCSDVFHFAVVRDVTKPLNTGANKLNDRVLLQMPDANAQVYTKNAVSEARSSEFNRFYSYNGSSSSIRTKKYVTKKTENKYKIQLNLGGTYTSSTPITKIDGSTAGSTSPYTDLSATGEHSPIEMYAISTFYGAWPNTLTASYKYSPVVPYGTTFPSGQTHNSSTTGDTNISYLLGHEYFYSGEGAYSSNAWRIPDSATMGWHSYTKTSSWNSDKIVSSNSNTEIKSRIDDNNNLIIEIPNTQSTAPISVFLRDGCGNMQYVVCGLYEESAGKEVAISFIIDDKLGSAPTSEGVVTKPFIIQFPYSLADSSGDVPWGSQIYKVGDQSANSEDPSSYKGTGQKRGFIKDYVKYATYYNPDLVPTLKHGFALHFFPNNVDRSVASNITGKEDVTFSDAGWTDEEKAKGIRQASASDIADGNYTCRALLYCTDSPSTPSYTTIKTLHDTQFANGTTEATRTGQVTDWTYLQVSSSAIEAILLLDYPKPNYSKLNWSTNETNGEPKPFYMWYIFEDRVGNYELAKVVNDATSGNDLKTTNSSHFDKWLYDNEAPKITIRGTSTNPNTITAANIGQLVATNNGFVPYANNGTVYVHSNYDNSSVRSGGSKNTTIGKGTTLVVDGSSYESKTIYNPFFDIEVSERTGVRAFAWSTSNDVTFSTSTTDYYYYYSRTDNSWYVGWSSASLNKDIGDTWSYSEKPTNAYYGSGSNYSGKYSGVKVNTVVPYGKINSSENELWLHVIDWTGNISSYKMGNGLKFRDDSTAPAYYSSEFTGITEPDQYYLSKEENANPVVRIAGNGPTAKAGSDIKLYIPRTWIEEAGSGIKGYSFSNTGIANATYDENGVPYLNLTYSDYHYTDTDSHEKTFYVYDNVGNMSERKINLVFDDKPPKITKVAFVTKLDSSDQGKFCDAENGLATQNVGNENYPTFGSVQFYTHKDKNSANEDINLYYDDISQNHFKDGEVQEIYINKAGAVKFQVNFDNEITTDSDYLDDIKINRWNDTTKEWETVTSWKSDNESWWTGGLGTVIRAMGTSDSTGYDKLTYTADGTYYQILATDISGNASCQYFKLYLDNQGPELVARTGETSTTPTIELGKGSINKDGTDTYYYTADSTDKATIKFAMTDAGMKNSKQKFYYSFDNSTWETINKPADTLTEINATVASGNLDKIYLKDIFENKSTIDVNFKYTYGSNDTTIDIPALTYWNTKPATPTFKVYANDATILTTDNFSGNDGWSAWNTSLLEDSTDTIAINGKSLKWAKISFAKSDKIIGYLVTDGEGNLIKEAEYGKAQQYGQTIYVQNIKDTYLSDEYKEAVGSYSFKTDLKDTFTETLPLLKGNGVNTSYAQATRKYYAVDVVGNISDALTLTYSYSNPSHQATDIHLIRNLDEIEASDVKNTITAAVNNGTLKLAQIEDSVVGTTTTRYFSGDYLLLSCTLKAKASDTNDDTPAKVELVDIWGGAAAGSAVRGYAQGDNIIFYPSNQKNNDDRYYCYVAFKVDAFDNNDQYGGSQLYLRVYGKPSQSNPKGTESDSFLINPANEINIRWKRDTSAPVIKSVYIDESRLKGYKASGDVTIGYDNKTWTNGMTNYYSRGMYIYLPVADITDGITYTGNDNNDIGLHKNDFITYAGTAQYKTIVTGGSSDVDSGWQNVGTETISWDNTDTLCYKIAMPNVETVHSEITLKIRDGVGNESVGIRIGKSDYVDSLWWLVDDLLTQTGAQTTITAPTVEWPNPTDLTGYTFDVTPPVGSIIKSITAKIPGSDTNLVKDVSFNDYKSQPTMNGSNGWINVNGLKVTLNKIAQTWSPQDVVFTINGVAANSTVTKPVTSFVPAKKLNDGNVIVTEATWVSGTQSYAITVELKDGDDALDLTKLSGMTFTAKLDDNEKDNLSAEFSNSKITISGSDIPTEKTWADQVITVSISGENINGTITKTVLTVPKKELTASDVVSISDAAIPEGGSAYQVSINLQEGIPDSAISTVTVTPEGVGVSLSGHTVTLSNIPAATWADQYITLSVNGNVASKKVLTIPAKTLTASDVTLSTATWSETAESYEITVTRNNGAPASALTSVSANNDVTAAFNDDKSKVTLTGMTKGWTQKLVKLTFNGNVTPDTVVLTIPAKDLSANDIEVSSATYDATKTSYTLTVEMKNGAPASLLTKITADNNVSAHLSNDKASVTLTSIPAQGWTAKEIKLTANSNIDLGVKLTVPALLIKSNNITWGTSPTWNASTNEYSISITLAKGDASTAPDIKLLKNMTYTVSINGTINENISARLSTSSGNKIKFSGEILKTKTWDAQLITININGANIDGTISKDIFTIPAKTLTASDIDSISDAAIPEGETAYKVTINLKDGVPNSAITSVSADNDVTTSLDGNIVTLGNIPAATWTAQDITLSVNGNIASKKVLTIAAKEVSASDVGITVTDPSNGTWVDSLDTVKFKITLSSDLTIKDVSVSDDTVTLSKSGSGSNIVYTLTGKNDAKIPKTITVNVKTNKNTETAISVRVFPETVDENRISTGLNILSGGLSQASKWNETQDSGIMNFITALDPFASVEELPVNAAKDKKAAKAKKAGKTTAAATSAKPETKAAPDAAPAAQVAQITQLAQIEQLEQIEQAALSAITEEVTAIDSAAISTQAKAPDQITPLASQASADTLAVETGSNSKAVLWIILCMFCIAVAGVVFGFKKKEEK